MSTALDNLTAKVQAQSTVIASAETLLSSLSQAIRDNTGDEDALNALADQIDHQTGELSQAVQANTPAANAPAPATDQPDPATDQPTA